MWKSYMCLADCPDLKPICTSVMWMFRKTFRCLQCADFCKTLASTTMAGFSMSALLWTILSSSCAGLGLFPGPAISEREKRIWAAERKHQVFGLWLTGLPSGQRVILVSVNAMPGNPLAPFYIQLYLLHVIYFYSKYLTIAKPNLWHGKPYRVM